MSTSGAWTGRTLSAAHSHGSATCLRLGLRARGDPPAHGRGPLACCVERPDQLSNNVGEGGPMLKLSGPLRFSLIPSAHAGPEPVGPSTFEVMAGL